MSGAMTEEEILRIRNQLLKEEDLWREREDYQEQRDMEYEQWLDSLENEDEG